jgi:hypothetical protein
MKNIDVIVVAVELEAQKLESERLTSSVVLPLAELRTKSKRV